MFRVGLASTLGLLVLVSGAQPEHDIGPEAITAPLEPLREPLLFGGLPNHEKEDEIARPFSQASAMLAVTDAASTKQGEPNTDYQTFRKPFLTSRIQLKQGIGRMCTLYLWPLSAI